MDTRSTGELARKFLRPEVLRTVARLDLKARIIVEGLMQGLHRSPYHGFSAEFSDYRDYVPGDDPSLIDWKLYARTDRYYVKRFEAETNLRCMLMVDVSASMHYASGGPGAFTKLEYAVALAASLGYLMIRQQDSVGLVMLDSRVRCFVPPRSKRSHLFTILRQLLAARPAEKTDLASALEGASALVKRRGLVILFSDLLDRSEAVIERLRLLRGKGHDLIVFQVLDPAELRFPFRHARSFQDPETGLLIEADPELVRRTYIERLRELLRSYRRNLRSVGIDYLLMDTSTPFHRALLKFLHYRRRRH